MRSRPKHVNGFGGGGAGEFEGEFPLAPLQWIEPCSFIVLLYKKKSSQNKYRNSLQNVDVCRNGSAKNTIETRCRDGCVQVRQMTPSLQFSFLLHKRKDIGMGLLV